MIVYQKDVKKSSAVKCGRGDFWREVRSQKTRWHIDARRAVKAAVKADLEGEGVAAVYTWLQNTDFQKFLQRKPRELKSEKAKKAFARKSDEEKLLAWAEELKQELTGFIFSCYLFDEVKRKRKKKDGTEFEVTERPRQLKYCHLNGLVMLDIDHVENPLEIWWKLREMKELMDRVALVHISCSGDGIRIIFTADISLGNLADNQIAFAKALGYKADSSCIDATRTSFCPKEEDIIYINEELLFNYYNEEFDKRFTPEYRQKKTQPVRFQFDSDGRHGDDRKPVAAVVAPAAGEQGTEAVGPVDAQRVEGVANGQCSMVNGQCSTVNGQCSMVNGQCINWRGYDIQRIIDARYGDRLPCAEDSNRHKESLKLATDLLLMLDGDRQTVQRIVEAQPWVQEIIAERDENVGQTIESAVSCVAEKEKKYAGSLPSKAMQEAVKKATGKEYREVTSPDPSKGGEGLPESSARRHSSPLGRPGEVYINSQLEGWGAEIESLFDDFPLLRDVCAGLKRSQYPAAVFTAGGTLMTLMTRCWYRFYHRAYQDRRLNCSLYIIGHPASNKSMADDICETLIAPVAAADNAGKAALNRYKKDTKKKAANKEGKDKPQGIIRIHPSRTSNGQLIEDMLNAKEVVDGKEIQLHMFTFDTELDNSITLQGGGSWINKQAMELKAFHNEKDGQMYQNSDSPVDEFRVTWNYIYSGTPIALKKKVNERNFGSGLSTRLTVIPMPKTNYEMIGYEEEETVDWERLERMKAWAFKLDARAGQLPVKPLVRKLYDWTSNRMADCAEDDSEANELMLKRVPYHALNYSVPFIDIRHFGELHQEGKFWEGEYEVDETDWKLCELIARIQYATQQHFFGVMAEKYFDDMNNDVQITGRRHQQRSLDGYNRLPEVFTREDVKKCFGYNNDNTVTKKISRLINMHAIEEIKNETSELTYMKLAANLR